MGEHTLEDDKSRFEIINPSDEAYLAGDFKTVSVATFVALGPKYGLEEAEGDRTMPLLFGGAWRDWFPDEFGKPVNELARDIGVDALIDALRSMELARERTSLNDFVARAHELADDMEDMSDDTVFDKIDDMVSSVDDGDADE